LVAFREGAAEGENESLGLGGGGIIRSVAGGSDDVISGGEKTIDKGGLVLLS
jgi:hypothetical protein